MENKIVAQIHITKIEGGMVYGHETWMCCDHDECEGIPSVRYPALDDYETLREGMSWIDVPETVVSTTVGALRAHENIFNALRVKDDHPVIAYGNRRLVCAATGLELVPAEAEERAEWVEFLLSL